MSKLSLKLAFLPGALLAIPSAMTGASLIYEGFDYGLTNKAITGTATTATGLTGSYTTVSNNGTSTYTATGLTFTGLATSGGALTLSVSPTTDSVKEFAYTHIPINVSVSAGTTVYQSMLVNLTANSLSTNTGDASLRLTATSNLTGNGNGSMVNAVKRIGTTSNTSGVYYAAGDSNPSGSAVISTSTTYLYISKFTNVGGTGGGDATTWILTEAQFEAWQLAGGTEADLNSVSGSFKTSKTSTANITFDTTKSLRFNTSEFSVDFNSGSTNYNNSGQLTTVFDELRFGTSLNDVLAFSTVPEPSTYASIMGGMILGIVALRRRRS